MVAMIKRWVGSTQILKRKDNTMTDEYDAIVVGSGAAGASTAYEMINAGMKVLILEKGPERSLQDFQESGVFGSTFKGSGRGDELKFINEEYLMPDRKEEIRFLEYSDIYGNQKKTGRTTYGWMSQLVGGGTVHYGGASFRFEESDFKMRTKFKHIAETLESKIGISQSYSADLYDWPIEYKEFSKWYALAEKRIGIAASPSSDLPPLPFNSASIQIMKGLSNYQNGNIKLLSTPMAINSSNHLNRSPCHHSGLCQDFACRYEAKSDMRVTLLREAQKTGRLTIQSNTFVRKIHKENSTVKSLECLIGDPNKNPKITYISAPIFVIGCEAMETNRLLLASKIGNKDVLGKYIMFHMTGGARSIATKNKTNTWKIAPHTAYIDAFYHDFSHGEKAFLKTGVFLVSSNGGPLQASSGIWGNRALRYFNEVYPYKMDLSYIGDAMPVSSNKIELVNELDSYGMQGTKITYQPHIFDHNAAIYMQKRATEILKASEGITYDSTSDKTLKSFLKKEPTAHRLFHACGGCRMGKDPKYSVVDENCKLHNIDNLYITDASVFPTSSGKNPTLTIQANAMRIGHHIAMKYLKRNP